MPTERRVYFVREPTAVTNILKIDLAPKTTWPETPSYILVAMVGSIVQTVARDSPLFDENARRIEWRDFPAKNAAAMLYSVFNQGEREASLRQ
jgi:hypothetical protein